MNNRGHQVFINSSNDTG